MIVPIIEPYIPRKKPSNRKINLIFDGRVPIADREPISFVLSYTAIIITFITETSTIPIKIILINKDIISIILAIL